MGIKHDWCLIDLVTLLLDFISSTNYFMVLPYTLIVDAFEQIYSWKHNTLQILSFSIIIILIQHMHVMSIAISLVVKIIMCHFSACVWDRILHNTN